MTAEAPGGSILGGHWPMTYPMLGTHNVCPVSGGEKGFPDILKLLH